MTYSRLIDFSHISNGAGILYSVARCGCEIIQEKKILYFTTEKLFLFQENLYLAEKSILHNAEAAMNTNLVDYQRN